MTQLSPKSRVTNAWSPSFIEGAAEGEEWLLERFVSEVERTEVHAEADPRADVEVCLHGLGGIHVHCGSGLLGRLWQRGSWGGQRPSLADYVTVIEARDRATAARRP
jgi:hypothetical protein